MVLICNCTFIIASNTSTICAMTTVDTNSRGDKARLPRDERRAILLSAALEVFTAAGYHSAAMDEILIH